MTYFFAYNNMVKDMKLDDFKKFVRKNPHLINYVKNNKMTWQKFYEIYDLYGPDDNIWNDFKDSNSESNNVDNNIINTIKGIASLVKGIDLKSVQKALSSLDKAIDAFKGFSNNGNNEVYEERPKNKYFED